MDCFSKMIQLDVCISDDSSAIRDGFFRRNRTYGKMKTLISDGGTHSVNYELGWFLKRLGVQHVVTMAYDHRSNCIVYCNKSVLQLVRRNLSAYSRLRWW